MLLSSAMHVGFSLKISVFPSSKRHLGSLVIDRNILLIDFWQRVLWLCSSNPYPSYIMPLNKGFIIEMPKPRRSLFSITSLAAGKLAACLPAMVDEVRALSRCERLWLPSGCPAYLKPCCMSASRMSDDTTAILRDIYSEAQAAARWYERPFYIV